MLTVTTDRYEDSNRKKRERERRQHVWVRRMSVRPWREKSNSWGPVKFGKTCDQGPPPHPSRISCATRSHLLWRERQASRSRASRRSLARTTVYVNCSVSLFLPVQSRLRVTASFFWSPVAFHFLPLIPLSGRPFDSSKLAIVAIGKKLPILQKTLSQTNWNRIHFQ